MNHYVNYEGGKLHFSLPSGWRSIVDEDRPPVPGTADPVKEIQHALDHPMGSPPIEELARPGMDVVVLFDDLQRPTPASLALPELMDRLNRGGVPDEQITAICAVGTHPAPTLDQMKTKIGSKAFTRLNGRVLSHNPHDKDNILIGRTDRGTLVEVNQRVALADLIIGVGQCMPHPIAGFGGGSKIIMPGVCSYRSTADHHFTWMRNRNSRVNLLDGNPFYEDSVDAARLARLAFKLDLIMNENKEVIRAFAGDPVEEHKQASRYAESLYRILLPKLADVTITSAYPLEIGVQASKALDMAALCTRAGGTIIWVAPQKEAGSLMPLLQEMGSPEGSTDFHRRLIEGDIPDHLKAFGISYIMVVVYYKERAEKFHVFHVTEGFTAEQVAMMKLIYCPNLQDAVDRVSKTMPTADVAIFPSGGTIIPEIRR